MKNETHISHSSSETHLIAKKFGSQVPANAIIAFSGDLGAGKTTFIRGLAEGAAHVDTREVCSPTFTYLNIYTGTNTIYHFDLYRLPDATEFLNAGFADYLNMNGICCIEWSEKIASILPPSTIRVNLSYLAQEKRSIEVVW